MVSVCMAAYNGEKFIAKQIDSVLSQLGLHDELVISDDGSSDKTQDIIRAYHDDRIKLFTDSNAKSVVHNFGYALSKAKGDHIFLCDQDDVWYPEKVETCVQLLKDYDLVVTDCKISDDSLQLIEDSYFKILNSGPGLIKNLRKNTFLGCCMCFNKSLMPLILPFPKDIPMHDIWISFVATLFGTVKFDNRIMMVYRRHQHTVTHQELGRSMNNIFGKVTNRINQLKYIPLLIKRRLQNPR